MVVPLCVALSGCYWVIEPGEHLRAKFDEVVEGMGEDEVIDIMGRPSYTEETEMVYLYDYPGSQVRIRFVLDAEKIVTGKHYETAEELREKTPEEIEGEKIEEGEAKEKDAYPGGPLPRFHSDRKRRSR